MTSEDEKEASLDKEIAKIQKSTQATVPVMVPLHDVLRQKYRWYYHWHLNPFSSIVHSGILAIYVLILLLVVVVSYAGPTPQPAKAASYVSATSGNWNDPVTWGDLGPPGTGDDVTISAGHTVTLTASTSVGTVTIANTGTLALGSSGYILTLDGAVATPLSVSGTLTPGTSTVKYTSVNGSGAVTVATTTYNNLQFTPASAETYNLGGNLTGANALTGNLTIDANATIDVRPSSTDYSITGVNMTVSASGILDATSSGATFTFSGNWDHSAGACKCSIANSSTNTLVLSGSRPIN